MILVSHRGNINGRIPERENEPKYIEKTMQQGFEVEVDVWYINHKLYLGHDKPNHMVPNEFLKKKQILFHAKNKEALFYLKEQGAHVFWHQDDKYTMTSKGLIICHPFSDPIPGSLFMLPELENREYDNCYAICSDFIINYR